jgi:hypothetical protein
VKAAGAAVMVLSSADPYVVMKYSHSAISATPQSRLASSTGTLFGYGYRDEAE